MTTEKNDEQLIEDLLDRGTENIIPSRQALAERLISGEKLNVYYGIDPTAPHIHLGHAFNLRKLQLMVDLGHNVTFLIGDFTALVGDTSDKNDERPQLTHDEIAQNVADFKAQAEKFLDFSRVTLRHNSEWLSELSFADIMKTAANFSVNDFISRELIRQRLDEGKRVGLIETLYPLMQGYDSMQLDTDVQFGATDQTFNMQAGRTLIKRLKNKESFVVASGYLSGTDGRKMSKSWDNAIWLDDPAEEVFGKVMRISDDVLREFFVLGTNLPLSEIEQTMAQVEDGSLHPMEAKKQLARQITSELCGEEAVSSAEEHFVSTTQNKEAGDDVKTINAAERLGDTPTGSDLISVLVDEGYCESNSDARRLFEQGAIRLNDNKIDLDSPLQLNDGKNIVRIGKRQYLGLEK